MKKIIGAGIILLSLTAHSAMAANTPQSTVKFSHSTEWGLGVELNGAQMNLTSSCPNRFIILNTDTEYDLKVSMLLTAYVNGKNVSFNYNSTSANCLTPINNLSIY